MVEVILVVGVIRGDEVILVVGMIEMITVVEVRHGKGPPGYSPGPDLGPFFTNLDRTAVLSLSLERTWKVPDFLQIDRPVLLKLLKEDFLSIS